MRGTPSFSLPNSFDVQRWIAAHFVSCIENTGARKFSLHADGDVSEAPFLLVRVVPDLCPTGSLLIGMTSSGSLLRILSSPLHCLDGGKEKHTLPGP